jgi:hypothetical protein
VILLFPTYLSVARLRSYLLTNNAAGLISLRLLTISRLAEMTELRFRDADFSTSGTLKNVSLQIAGTFTEGSLGRSETLTPVCADTLKWVSSGIRFRLASLRDLHSGNPSNSGMCPAGRRIFAGM